MMAAEPVWVSPELVRAIHERQLAEHGGSEGVRDPGMLESALSRARQKYSYASTQFDILDLAAAYAFEIARNHPFMDGNKRTAYVVCRTFLVLNGWDLIGPLADRYPVFLALAAGELDEAEFAGWLRRHSRPEQVSEPAGGYA